METIRRTLPSLTLIALLLLTQSCENHTVSADQSVSFFTPDKVDIDELTANLKRNFSSEKTGFVFDGDSLKPFAEYQKVYSEHGFKPHWMDKNGLNTRAKDFLHHIDSLRYDGINLEKLDVSKIAALESLMNTEHISAASALSSELLLTKIFFHAAKVMVLGELSDSNKNWKIKNDSLFSEAKIMQETLNNNITNAFNAMRPQHHWYTQFRQEYIKVSNTTFLPEFTDTLGMRDSTDSVYVSDRIPDLRKKLFQEIGIPIDTSSNAWTEDLTESIKQLQYLNQLKQTGKVDSACLSVLNRSKEEKLKKLALNMDRMRRMNRTFKQPFIWVVVPRMELDYIDHDQVKFNMRVVVGRVSRPTPSLTSNIANIVFSPPWTVPPTIMKEEVIPGIARRGPGYLSRRGLKAYDKNGKLVNPSAINASNFRSYKIGQAPGYRSSLGEVKFNMINPWAIYMHDTPHREDFVKAYRAFSSGCIRVHHPKEFAEFLLQDTVKYSYAKIDSICKKRKTIYVPMQRKIDVHVVYLTNALDSAGHLMYLKDLYGWDKKFGN